MLAAFVGGCEPRVGGSAALSFVHVHTWRHLSHSAHSAFSVPELGSVLLLALATPLLLPAQPARVAWRETVGGCDPGA